MTNVKDQVAEALAMMVRCAYPVSTDIDPRGYAWSEAWLDDVLPIAKAALSLLTAPVPEAPEAPGAPGAEEVNDIWRRHEAADKAIRYQGMLDAAHLSRTAHDAHTDRATLLSALDAERAARVEAEGRLAKMLWPTIQWDPDNPEVPIDSVEDLAESFVDYGNMCGVFAVDNAHVLPSTYHYFEAGTDDDTGNVGETVCREITKDEYNGARVAMGVGWFAKKAKWHTERLSAALKESGHE